MFLLKMVLVGLLQLQSRCEKEYYMFASVKKCYTEMLPVCTTCLRIKNSVLYQKCVFVFFI
jgi:hypothetical protein